MKALYRKYRPLSLDEVISEDEVTLSLKNAIKNNKISHAYLFTGPRGCGKTSCARIFAHAINNFPYTLEDSYVDIIEIDAASNTGVDNIRDLREKACIAPTLGKYKVYIIDEVHMLSKSAFNALLKTLEEPPEHVVFILATTDIEKVPVTITSRVQIYSFHLADENQLLTYLKTICEKEKIPIEDDALKLIIEKGGGSFRDTLSILDQISNLSSESITRDMIISAFGLPENEMVTELLESYKTQDLNTVTEKLKNIFQKGINPEIISTSLIKTILKNPEPVFLPLLEGLMDVKGDFVEAKLLLALTNFKNKPSTSVVSEVSRPNPILGPNPSPNPQVKSVTALEDQQPVVAQTSSDFNFEGYMESVKKMSLGAAMWLRKCKNKFEDKTLHLYPDSPTTKGIIESANNHAVLLKCLGDDIRLNIHEPGESLITKKLQNTSKLNAIRDIMGEIKEVDDGGESPF